ncbi:unannotated protein [freshwater metagenome]|uniref:Unannotated protein n=1 Tax=freshwater metagenome TaxID=449393 RepID=A0A6J7E2Z1_9ZZZZ
MVRCCISRALGLVVVAVLCAGLAACGSAGQAQEVAAAAGAAEADHAGNAETAGAPASGEAGTSCTGVIGVIAPFGGTTARDSIQMNWARVSLDHFNSVHGTSFTIDPANVDTDIAAGRREARRLGEDEDVVGIVGPASSRVVEAVGSILDDAALSYVSPSATRVSLTDGHLKGFYRVVPNDDKQAPAISAFISERLRPRKVLVADQDDPYSAPLAAGIIKDLRKRGVPIQYVRLPAGQQSVKDIAGQVDPEVEVVVLPLIDVALANRFIAAVQATGMRPAVVGADSLFVPAFDQAGAYVSSFGPDATTSAAGREAVRLYQAIFGEFEAFGGPAYAAMEVVATAALETCKGGRANREGVSEGLPKVVLEESPLGTPISFDAQHEVREGSYRIFRVTSGGYQQVG